MIKSWKYLIILSWAYFMLVVSILLFSRGFFLRRNAVLEKSQCLSPNLFDESKNLLFMDSKRNATNGYNTNTRLLLDIISNSSMCVPSSTKVILIIVDALRYDFLKYDDNLNQTQSFRNKIPIVRDLIKHKPQNARLFKFIADPPTTTMQRLKGITTGSLPTFIDVGSNFATSEIIEDNFIDQILSREWRIVFMGDDTWSGLYPRKFAREFAFPSFNVWDLDTVDNGILKHLIPEIQKDDWKLLIAHFLGVDHCGHKFGPRHPEMKRKLEEVNKMIKNTIDAIDEKTVVFVFGDHGMTATGDHGGESEDEVSAGLFVYSSLPLFARDVVKYSDTVNQIDIVPTLSFILGIPIPFSNLGKVILGALPYLDKGTSLIDRKYAIMTLWRNVRQVKDYLDYYTKYLGGFPSDKLGNLDNLYKEVQGMLHLAHDFGEFEKILEASFKFLSLARHMCAEIWVQFDFILMTAGLFFMSIFIVLFIFIQGGLNDERMQKFTRNNRTVSFMVFQVLISFSVCVLLYKNNFMENYDVLFYMFNCSLAFLFILLALLKNWSYARNQLIVNLKLQDMVSVCALVIFIASLLGTFSNSYVVEESSVISYFLITLSFIVLYGNCWKESSKSKHPKNRHRWKCHQWRLKTVAVVLMFAVTLRISHQYWRCREEQKWCSISDWMKVPSSSVFSTIGANLLYSLVCLALLVTLFRMWLRCCGNLVGFSLIVTVVRYLPTVIAICISAYWVLQGFPKTGKYGMNMWMIQLWPLMVFIFIGFSIFILFAFPLSIFIMPKTRVSLQGVYGQDNIIPHLFNQIKGSLDKRNKYGKLNNLEDFPVVYGLATVYSASVIIFSLFVLLLIILLLGYVFTPSAFLMFVATIFSLAIYALSRHEKLIMSTQLFYVPWSAIMWWSFLSTYFFYATGHQPTFSSIQWDSAFVGSEGNFSTNAIPAFLIVVNTFASHLWYGVTLPLLLLSPFTTAVMFPRLIKSEEMKEEMKRGELILYEKEGLFLHALFSLSSKFVLLSAIRVFSCMAAAALHCRHLMVWKIFAPKLLFESFGLFVSMIGVLIGFMLVLRVTKSLKALMRSLE